MTSWDGAVAVFDVDARRQTLALPGGGHGPATARWAPDGARLAVARARERMVRLIDAADGRELVRFEGHTEMVYGLSFSADGRWLVTTSGGLGVHTDENGKRRPAEGQPEDCSIRIWDVGTGRELVRMLGHEKFVSTAVASPDGRLVASGSLDQTVRLWDAQTGAELACLTGHACLVHGIAFAADGRTVFSASRDRSVRAWKVAIR